MPTSDLPSRRRPLVIGLAVGWCAALAGGLAAAAERSARGAVASVAVGLLAEVVAAHRPPDAGSLLARVRVDPPVRLALWLLVTLLLAARTTNGGVTLGVAVAAAVLVGLAVARSAVMPLLSQLRRPPLLSRNLPLGGLRVPAAVPPLVLGPTVEALAALVAVVAVAVTGRAHPDAAAAGLSLATAVLALGAAWPLGQAVLLHRRRVRAAVIAAVTAAVDRLRPQVVLYFAGTPEEVYQPDMWLEPVAALGRPALVVLRDSEVLARLGPTSLPVVCTPYNGTLATLPLPDASVALFPTHSGNNLAMLRRSGVRTVFVGHGDSDKPDSVNRFARVYDQVWVAGPLGRRRYHDAAVGVDDAAVVEVGRPQYSPGAASGPAVTTVLYAPTWEGWGDDPHHSSLPHVGARLVAALLAHPGVRVLYRPHPLTGRRDPTLRRANAEIVRLLTDAGAVRAGPPRDRPEHDDLLDAALDSAAPSADGAGFRQQAELAYWSGAASGAHHVLDRGWPSLSSCFDQSSLLVGDVSSVVNEYLAWNRPYALVDTRGMGPQAFVLRFPSAAGAEVIAADLTGLDEVVSQVTRGEDPRAAERGVLLRDALGDPDTSRDRFAAAVTRLLSQ